MVIGSNDLDRLADDIDKERIILTSVYCGGCGYNLRTLPSTYRCPECGAEYSTRARKMKGIFNPNESEFPLRDVLITIGSIAATFVLGVPAIRGRSIIGLAVAAFFVAVAIISGRAAFDGFLRYQRVSGLLARIQRDEEADE